ncbi:MAG TPA: hypothetical protein VGQ46_20755 [Thermoanaerobaculia bacterium]|jgi:hypothetical protein|nr:hypothetical protein [Thermoanaerobaculia bacterium]
MNPYRDATPEQRETERTVIIDPATGEISTIGARLERLAVDAAGRLHREIVHVVLPSADAQELLFPYGEKLYACACCHAQPLVQPFRCAACARPMCAACRVIDHDVTLCAACGKKTLLQQVVAWLADL